MMKAKLPSIVTIMILTVITVIFWIALDVYRALSVKPAPSVSEEILSPLDSSLDVETLNTLKNRVYIEDSLISPIPLKQPTSQIPVVNSPAPIETPSSTPSP